jgi:hypothetical protein
MTDKTRMVIPVKVFEILAARRPLITTDTLAIREWLTPGEWVKLVPAGTPGKFSASHAGFYEVATPPGIFFG